MQDVQLVLRTPHPAGGSPVSKHKIGGSGFGCQVSGRRKELDTVTSLNVTSIWIFGSLSKSDDRVFRTSMEWG
jgi:hypothetical protein